MLGQMGHFHKYAKGTDEQLKYGRERYLKEGKRLYGVLDKQLSGHAYVVGDALTIADFAIWPWIKCVEQYYKLDQHFTEFENVAEYAKRMEERATVQRGLVACMWD
jgi:GSH-dependent disulfide-bond oxidoreductase